MDPPRCTPSPAPGGCTVARRPGVGASRPDGQWPFITFNRREGSIVTRLLTRVWIALRSRKGQSLVEYALILALVAIVVITALTALGGNAQNSLSNVSNTIGNVA